jgi:hypothetical protein
MRVRMDGFECCVYLHLPQNYAPAMPATMHDQPFFTAAITPPRRVELDLRQAGRKRCSVKEIVS